MAEAKGAPFEICLSADRREAVRDASYVLTQLRVGGMAARRADEYLGQRHGLIGQETTGVGGMAMALRTPGQLPPQGVPKITYPSQSSTRKPGAKGLTNRTPSTTCPSEKSSLKTTGIWFSFAVAQI
jgi:hypothetical protein